jgi:hypothetical protein
MKVGEVFVWETDKALGHTLRTKFHIFICPEDADDGHTFLFISSTDYKGDFPIKKSDYPFLEKDSFISLGRTVCYTSSEMKGYTTKSVGQIKDSHLKELFHATQGSPTMEGREIKRVCNILKNFV